VLLASVQKFNDKLSRNKLSGSNFETKFLVTVEEVPDSRLYWK